MSGVAQPPRYCRAVEFPPAGYREVTEAEAQRANRRDWDLEADGYQREHGAFLRDDGFVWSPEGLDEADVHLLGDIAGRRVLEIGCGAAQCSRWLRAHGADAVGLDLSMRQLQHSVRIDLDKTGGVPLVCGSATALPFADETFDLAFSAFGGLSFTVHLAAALGEARRVLRPGGTLVFSVVHPVRWMFPDDPGPRGLTVIRSYFDRTPYVELDPAGTPSYVEPHHTLADWVSAITASGLVVESLTEPAWPRDHERVWGGWGPVRGALLPGTLVVSARRPAQ
jgi:SAM-dependent methyltransferase